MADALEAHEEIITETGETMNPTLHVALHGVVANQLMHDEPTETWQTVQRLAATCTCPCRARSGPRSGRTGGSRFRPGAATGRGYSIGKTRQRSEMTFGDFGAPVSVSAPPAS